MKSLTKAPACTYTILYGQGGGAVELDINKDGINIGTISGGIVNFGGAVCISPISVTRTISGSDGGNSGTSVTTNTRLSSVNQQTVTDILNLIRTML
ncbi:spore germination protein [Neobacillus cucumis]|nr:spore germination protein [Neobacillus cucumis]